MHNLIRVSLLTNMFEVDRTHWVGGVDEDSRPNKILDIYEHVRCLYLLEYQIHNSSAVF